VAAESLEVQEVNVTGSRRVAGRGAAPHKNAAAPAGARVLRQQVQNDAEAYAPVAPPPPAAQQVEGNDKFQHFDLNSIKQPALEAERVSTFSADVDTSSYSFVRKQLDQGRLPQKDAVRAEEMINYFDYAWPAADSREQPFRPTVVVSDSPWGKGRKLIHVGIKGYELPANKRPDANLVMLIDVSGSMDEPDKLPLVKESMKLLLGSLKPTDTVGIVVYAGAAGMVLPPTEVGDREKITAALERLQAGGSTAGGQGIELAYQLAEKSFRKDAVNRILLCTDGDFNVGISGTEELKGLVERKREKGIFLSVLGYGQGNYRDELAQALAQNGNGVAAYIDTLNEARKVLVEQAGSSLFTIAKDVKFQVEFNPATVAEYRLVGYETRALKTEDFNNDKIDAGDIGAGHTVTAIYEITPVGSKARMIDKSRYVKQPEVEGSATEYGFLKMRYKLPDQDKSQLMEQAIRVDTGKASEAIQRDVGFSTAVAGFAQLLRGGQFTGSLGYDDVIRQAQANRGEDPHGYRSEFVQLVRKAQTAR
jgi:Ca-activated chloride channel family protein